MSAPIVSWYEGENKVANEVKNVINYGVVDADSASPQKVFYIWNNRGGSEDCSKMEEVVFTTRDRQGGTGDTPGANVEAVRDNWFNVRCDSLEEQTFVPVGKGGIPANPEGSHPLGTKGSTKNIDAAGAVNWTAETILGLNTVIEGAGDYVFVVTKAGTTSTTEPVWPTVANQVVLDGTVEFTAVAKSQTPGVQEILGLKNNVLEDGSNAEDAAGNFVKITVFADVPIAASAGKNELLQRLGFRYV